MTDDKSTPRFSSARRYVLTGLLTVIPIWITWLVIKFILDLLAGVSGPLLTDLQEFLRPHIPLLADWLEEYWFQTILAVILIVLALYFLGWLTTKVIGQQLIAWFDGIMERIPKGEHLAVGNDALKADMLCELAAARSGGFAFPPLWYGEPRVTALAETAFTDCDEIKAKMRLKRRKFVEAHFGKTGDDQVAFYQALVRHLLVQMNQLEMKAVCLIGGHYPLAHFARPVVEQFNKDFKDTQAFVGIEGQYARKSKHVGGDHAGKWETSYLMYLRPDCVDMTVFLNRDKERLVGVGNIDPRTEATVEIGRKACDMMVDGMVRRARELIKKAS